MAFANTSSASIYNDFSGLTALKSQARQDKNAAIDDVARQFESLFMQMMLKGMRKAKLAEGMFNGETMQKYRDMYDQQLSVHLAEAGGIGLAAAIKRQLGGDNSQPFNRNRSFSDYQQSPVITAIKNLKVGSQQVESITPAANAVSQMEVDPATQPLAKFQTVLADNNIDSKQDQKLDGTVQTFVDKLKPYAQKAAAVLGIEPQALLAQAALETGWGKSVMKTANGQLSYNLFGIKADKRWAGKQANVSTLEFRDGIAKKERANFRAYDSFEQAFDDYARFVTENSRYHKALKQVDNPAAYFNELQQAGYATDPAYANKILKILNRGEIQNAFSEQNAKLSEES